MVKNLEKVVMWRSIFKVPTSGQDFGVMIKLSIWVSLGKRTKFKCHDKFSKLYPVFAAGAMPHNGPAIWGGCVA
jgi:hypothetical protein